MSIQFPVVPNVPGVPALVSFPGAAQIAGSISGNVLTINSGIDSIAQGLSLSGLGIDPATVLTSNLTSITTGLGLGSGVGTAFVNISQNVSSVAMDLAGSLGGLLPDLSDVLGGDTVEAQLGAGPTARWGLFLDGELAIEPDSFVATEYKKDWHISDYPIEQGTFESYNKVRVPFDFRITMTKGGTEDEREQFLQTLETIAAALDLYDVVTPERIYSNANVTHIDYSRSAQNGVSLLTVVLWLQEVRLEASSEFVSTAEPSSVSQINAGVVQSIPATIQEVQNFASTITDRAW